MLARRFLFWTVLYGNKCKETFFLEILNLPIYYQILYTLQVLEMF